MHRLLPVFLIAGLLQSCGAGNNSAGAAHSPAPDSLQVLAATPPGPARASGIEAAIKANTPAGFSVLDTATGDLNLDAYPDLLLALKNDARDTVEDEEVPRPLLILVGQPDGGYKLAARSDKVILCSWCGGVMGDPYQEMVVKNGYFSVEHYGGSSWRWTDIVTFKYHPEDGRWYLHKRGGESFQSGDPETTMKEKVQTEKDFGKVPFGAYQGQGQQ